MWDKQGMYVRDTVDHSEIVYAHKLYSYVTGFWKINHLVTFDILNIYNWSKALQWILQ